MKKKSKQQRWWIIPVVIIVLLMAASAMVNVLFPSPQIDLESQGHYPEYKSLDYGSHPGAPVTIVEFIDYQCPYCKEMHPVLKQLRDEFGTDINYVYIQAPNAAIHPQAAVAAAAAICAGQMGIMEEYSDLLFENQDNLEFENLQSLAQSLGADPLEFHTCMASDETKIILSDDLFEGEKVNLRGTPTIFINGARLEGIQDYRSLKTLIQALIENNNP